MTRCFFVGKVKVGESVKEAALRETWEESGFAASQLRIVSDFRHDITYRVRGYTKKVTYFLAELVDPEAEVKLSRREHFAYKWVTLSAAKEVANYKSIQTLLREAEACLTSGSTVASK